MFPHVGCLSLSVFVEISVVIFEAGASRIEKVEQGRKWLQRVYIFVEVDCWKSNVKDRVCCPCESKWRE